MNYAASCLSQLGIFHQGQRLQCEVFPAMLRSHCDRVGDRMALQLHHGIVIIRFQRQIAALGIALEESSFLQKTSDTVTDSLQLELTEIRHRVSGGTVEVFV